MSYNAAKPGYVLLFTIIIFSLLTLLVTRLLYVSFTARRMGAFITERYQARFSALSGIAVATSQLLTSPDEEQQEKQPKDQQPKDDESVRLKRILSVLNRWQTFQLDSVSDGVDGKLEIYTSCEEGKINFNTLYDPKQKQLHKRPVDMQALVTIGKEFIQPLWPNATIAKSCEALAQAGRYPVDDIHELTLAKGFEPAWPWFPSPEKTDEKSITDLFTVAPEEAYIAPFYLSSTLMRALDLKVLPIDEKKRAEAIEQIVRNFKPGAGVESQWDNAFAEWYGKRYSELPQVFRGIFRAQSRVSLFSVVSYGTVGSVTSGVCAIIRYRPKTKDQIETYVIESLWWL